MRCFNKVLIKPKSQFICNKESGANDIEGESKFFGVGEEVWVFDLGKKEGSLLMKLQTK